MERLSERAVAETLLDLKGENRPPPHVSHSAAEPNGTSAPSHEYLCIAPDVKVGRNVKFSKFVNLYGCEVGDDTKIGAFVEIQKNAKVGKRCEILSHTFICEGGTIQDEVFIGHNVTFVNDTFPRATTTVGSLQTEADWKVETTLVQRGASIGAGATILVNVVIEEHHLSGSEPLSRGMCRRMPSLWGIQVGWCDILSQEACMSHEKIPFLDLVTVHRELQDNLVEVLKVALNSAGFIGGLMVQGFKQEFAQFCEARDWVGVGNGCHC